MPPINVLRLSLHPEGLAPRIVNLTAWRTHLLARLRQQIEGSADPALEALHAELTGYAPPSDGTSPRRAGHHSTPLIVVPLQLQSPRGTLSLMSTTTVFGTPVDVTLAELAIESFFPADAATGALLRALAERAAYAESPSAPRRDPIAGAARSVQVVKSVFRISCLWLLVSTLPACDDDGDACVGGHCLCGDRPICALDCALGGCDTRCARTDECDLRCTDRCEIACNDTSRCESACGEGCALTCTRADVCALGCGAGCDVRCASVSQCDVRVGPDSQVECTSLSSCDVSCTGSCEVACSGVGQCNVRCPPGLVRCADGGLLRCAEQC